VIESEAGWGQKHEYMFFDSHEEALERKNKINSFNTESQTPSWYMIATDIEELKLVETWVKVK
jgi:hypothetical protein